MSIHMAPLGKFEESDETGVPPVSEKLQETLDASYNEYVLATTNPVTSPKPCNNGKCKNSTVTAADFCQSCTSIPKAIQNAPDFLRAGIKHMEARAVTYDNPEGERSMAATITAFNALTGHRLTEVQGWQFMALLKICRANQGKYKADNYEDGAAYMALAGEAAERTG